MKSTKNIDWNRLSKSFRQFLKEADDKEENPFAAKDDAADEDSKEADDKEENPFAAKEDGEDKGEDGKDKSEDSKDKASTEKPAGIPIKFNIGKVKQYNTAKFLSDTGIVKSINKDGVVVTTQPDQVDVLVNFDDISESVKRFFKPKK